MPMFDTACMCGYIHEKYLSHEFKRQTLHFCPNCENTLTFMPSFGIGLTYFEEGKARTFWNMADEPVTVRSYKEHEIAMKKHGVALAPARRGEPGCWA